MRTLCCLGIRVVAVVFGGSADVFGQEAATELTAVRTALYLLAVPGCAPLVIVARNTTKAAMRNAKIRVFADARVRLETAEATVALASASVSAPLACCRRSGGRRR